MKLWIDDIRPAPEGYRKAKSVNKAIEIILDTERKKAIAEIKASAFFRAHWRKAYTGIMRQIKRRYEIELIDIDHDAGEYADQGGDYIKLLDWLEETGRNYPIRIHSQNPVGVANMRRIIQRNGWEEVF